MTEYQLEQQAAAVEGELAGMLRCIHCRRWRGRDVMFPSNDYPYIRRHRCVDKTDCQLIRRQQHAANAIARQMLGELFHRCPECLSACACNDIPHCRHCDKKHGIR